LAKRKKTACKLRLRQTEQKIGLILAFVHSLEQLISPGCLIENNPRVVAGRNLAGADRVGHFQKLIELNEVIAERARDGRPPSQIVGHERLNHMCLELPFEIDNVVGYADL